MRCFHNLLSLQCINVTNVKWITQQKTVVERVCSDVPDQECKINTVIQDKPVNSTECKIVKENKCSIITVPTEEKECRKTFEKKCRTVSEIVTNIVQVRNDTIKQEHYTTYIMTGGGV